MSKRPPKRPPDPPASAGKQQAARDSRGRFQAGVSGNPSGRPKGSRAMIRNAILEAVEDFSPGLVRKGAQMAMDGDSGLLVWFLSRLIPPARDRLIPDLKLPPVNTAADALAALNAIAAEVRAGEVSPSEGAALAGLVSQQLRAVEASGLAEKIEALREALEAMEARHGRH